MSRTPAVHISKEPSCLYCKRSVYGKAGLICQQYVENIVDARQAETCAMFWDSRKESNWREPMPERKGMRR